MLEKLVPRLGVEPRTNRLRVGTRTFQGVSVCLKKQGQSFCGAVAYALTRFPALRRNSVKHRGTCYYFRYYRRRALLAPSNGCVAPFRFQGAVVLAQFLFPHRPLPRIVSAQLCQRTLLDLVECILPSCRLIALTRFHVVIGMNGQTKLVSTVRLSYQKFR